MGFRFVSTALFTRCFGGCVLACFVILSGCASSEDIGKIQWDINHMRSEIKELKQAAPASHQKNEVDNKLSGIEESQKATAGTVSDLLIQIQSMTSEFQMLTGKFEEVRFFTEQGFKDLTNSKDILTAKVTELEGAVQDLHKQIADIRTALSTAETERRMTEEKLQAAEAEKEKKAEQAKKAAEKKQEKTAVANTSTKTKLKDIYMAGYQAFREGKTAQAREDFSSIINNYPENEYSDNARFWIGETYYKEGNYTDAILAYEDLFKHNPNSDKVPGAMLKQGLSFYSIKDEKTGNIILEKLVEKYPDSEPAKLALKKLNKPAVPDKK